MKSIASSAPIDESAAKTLLALWLALKNTKVRLSPAEQSALEEIGLRADMRPDTRESIEKDLMALLQRNAALSGDE